MALVSEEYPTIKGPESPPPPPCRLKLQLSDDNAALQMVEPKHSKPEVSKI